MASVTSLDKDLRKLRLEKYTPAVANEARQWIEDTLGEKLSSADLLEGLKDGVALCKLINLALPAPGVRFKKSAMPFVQMENISQFLNACQTPPLSLHQHDTFLTVDLFEQKDPAQVLQCISAFSRAAHTVNPQKFPDPIGPKTRTGGLTPQPTGGGGTRNRGASIASDTSSAHGGVARSTASHDSASWSKSQKEPISAPPPAWNTAQYGFMGGASQGSLGISFGARRQVASAGPAVPSLADKERVRKEKIAEEERARHEEEERRRAVLNAEEEQVRLEEERSLEEKASRLRDEDRRKYEEEKRQWDEQERRWRLAEEKRRKEEEEAAARMEEERRQARTRSPAKLRGQFLSQYQAEQAAALAEAEQSADKQRIKELETELELARQREAEYERDRLGRGGPVPDAPAKIGATSRSRPITPRSPKPHSANNTSQLNRHESWSQGGEVLHTKWHQRQQEPVPETELEALSSPKSPRPLPDPNALPQNQAGAGSPRPLPDPAKYASPPRAPAQNRTDQFLASHPAPVQPAAQQIYAREVGGTQERDEEDRRRLQSQEKTTAGGWASRSLLEREMELERQRQREWEAAQQETAAAAAKMTDEQRAHGVDGIGGGIGGRWDVSQWSGYTGGENENKVSPGISAAGRRQIVGPRPLPNLTDQPPP
ncbi:Transgelin [Escovopsis weberi]|uniref:Transgelin n=1 Tax=Escovopsis weberi TaxID=150374 RepID=A0A0M9VRW2_ESCWE|nr:Transgelin [Escovopsis weberi]